MASIACPIFLRRHGYRLSPNGRSISLSGEAFKALSIWRRSPAFSSTSMLYCSFSHDIKQAALQIQYLKTLFCNLPPTPKMFFQHIYLAHVGAISLVNILALLHNSSLQAGCRAITISGISITSPDAVASTSSSQKRKSKAMACLDTLQDLSIRNSPLSSLQWTDFLSRLTIPSIHQLEIDGATSMKAVYNFLLRHSTIRSLHFDNRTSNNVRLLAHKKLTLPHLQSLKGPLMLVNNFLRSLSSPPSLHELVIEYSDDLPINTFIARVIDCLGMCKECLEVEVRHFRLKEEEIGAASTSCKIPSVLTDLSTIGSLLLCVKEISDEMFLVRIIIYSHYPCRSLLHCIRFMSMLG